MTLADPSRLRRAVSLAQSVIAVVAIGALFYWPRSERTVLVVPIGAPANAVIADLISSHDLRLVSRGRWNGSYVIEGYPNGFSANLLLQGVLTLDAAARGCGPAPTAEIPA